MAERRNNIRPLTPSAPPPTEIADDFANERSVITAEHFGPNLSTEEYLRQGFAPLKDGEAVVSELRRANYVEHITANGERKFYPARNFRVDQYDHENLLESKIVTDEETMDPAEEIKLQLEALRTGGKYRFVYGMPDITTRTGGAFLWFLKE